MINEHNNLEKIGKFAKCNAVVYKGLNNQNILRCEYGILNNTCFL